jgi:calcium-dependent protein kinase
LSKNRYCEHGELYDIIKDHKRSGFDEISTAYIMKQLLSVVYYCHSNSIINRDLRPENILVESEEKIIHDNKEVTLYNVRVSDFKSARTFKTSKKLNKKVGNPYYIAPEVLKRKYNEKCDIWSCGIIMYVLLTGKPPFSGSTDKEVLEKVEQNLFEYFDKDLAKVSPECKSLIKELTRYDPSKRPSAGEALKNKWFKTVHDLKSKFVNSDLMVDAYKNLMNFSPDFKFQQACFAFMIHHLTDHDEVRDLRKIFEYFDVNCDGKLSHQELIDGFKSVYSGKGEKEIQKVLKRIDQDKSGFIEFEEFIRATINKKIFISEEKIKIAFDLIKDSKSGTITVSELKVILGLASKQFSDKIWNEIISQIFHQVDENNDNEINYDEFKNMMIKLVI